MNLSEMSITEYERHENIIRLNEMLDMNVSIHTMMGSVPVRVIHLDYVDDHNLHIVYYDKHSGRKEGNFALGVLFYVQL